MVNRVSEYEFTSWHEYLGGADFFPLCNVNAVLGRISTDELTALVDAPLDNDVCCIEYEEERERSMSDDSVMLSLKDEYGITDGQQILKLSKEERDVILAAYQHVKGWKTWDDVPVNWRIKMKIVFHEYTEQL